MDSERERGGEFVDPLDYRRCNLCYILGFLLFIICEKQELNAHLTFKFVYDGIKMKIMSDFRTIFFIIPCVSAFHFHTDT